MIQVNIFISTFLVFLCCISQVSHVSAYSRFAGYIFSSRRSDLRALKSNFVDLNLGQSFQIDYFLKKYQVGTSRIQGVFAIEDKDGNVQVVDSGIDIAADISSILEHYKDSDYNFSVVRVQYFMDASSESLEAYCKELSKQTNPLIIKNEALNSKIRIVAPPTSTTSTIESPFASGGNVESNKSKLELTKANVNAVLDEIRPFLIADGGNVAVVNVDSNTRNIELSLQGACGSCPSSTVTSLTSLFFDLPTYCNIS